MEEQALLIIELLILGLCAAASDTPLGKRLRSLLVDAPVTAFRGATPRQLIVGLIVLCSLTAFVIGAPEWIALFGLGDLAAYLDVGLILLLSSAVLRLRSLLARAAPVVRGIIVRVIPRRGQGRRRGRRPRRTALSPDDDGGPAWATGILQGAAALAAPVPW